MKIKIKLIILVLVIIFISVTLAVCTYNSKDSKALVYGLKDDGTYEITAYKGIKKNLVIPHEHNGIAVTSIGEYAFLNRISLTEISIPDSITSIGSNAFLGTGWYTNQPDGLVYAGKVAYKYKGTMPPNTSITLLSDTKGIADKAFYANSKLIQITISNNVENIGEYAFSCDINKNMSLSEIIFEENSQLTSIGSYAFLRCTKLGDIKIPASVTSIGDGAFGECNSLATVTFGENSQLTSIGLHAFHDTAWYNNHLDGTIYAGKVAYTYKGIMPINIDVILLPGTKGIADGAFSNRKNLKSITIPNSVSNIGLSAFSGCTNLENFEVVEDNANYKSIDGVLFNKTVTTLIHYPQGNTRTSYAIPKSVTIIGASAFNNCSWLQSITLASKTPPTLELGWDIRTTLTMYVPSESVDDYKSASGWSEYKNRIYSDSLINENGFIIDNGLLIQYIGTENIIEIPSNVTSIGESSFSRCISITQIIIPEGVTRIGSNAFYECRSLAQIIVSDSVTSIGLNAFSNTLWYNNQPDGLVYVGKVTYTYKGIMTENTSITLLSDTIAIADNAFTSCNNLESITIPNSVTSIGLMAFADCSNLTQITIPDSVTNIDLLAFLYCSSLKSVIVESTTPLTLGLDVFALAHSELEIYVPSESVDAYKSAEGWSYYADRIYPKP